MSSTIFSTTKRRRLLVSTVLLVVITALSTLVVTGGNPPPSPENQLSGSDIELPQTHPLPKDGGEDVTMQPPKSSSNQQAKVAVVVNAPAAGTASVKGSHSGKKYGTATTTSSTLLPFLVDYQPSTVNTLLQYHMSETVKEVEGYVLNGPYRTRRDQSMLGRLGDTLGHIISNTSRSGITTAIREMMMWPAVAPTHYIRWAPPQPSSTTTPNSPIFSTCPSLLERDNLEVASLLQTATYSPDPSSSDTTAKFDGFRFTSLFYEYPTYNLPWYYHAPMPLCGRFLLRWLETRQNATRGGSVLKSSSSSLGSTRSMGIGAAGKMPRLFAYGKKGEMDRNFLPKPGDLRGLIHLEQGPVLTQRNVHRVVVVGTQSTTASHNAKLTGLPVVDFKESVAVKGHILVENCGTMHGRTRYFGPVGGGTSQPDDDVLIMARLAGPKRIVGASVVPLPPSSDAASSSIKYDVQFILPSYIDVPGADGGGGSNIVDPNEYVLEIRYVHINGTDGDWHNPYPLGTIGIRANDHGRKGFKYNLQCDMQRHVYGSPLVVRVVASSSTASSIIHVRAPPPSTTSDSGNEMVTLPPQCTRADHEEGYWVEYPAITISKGGAGSPHYIGNPTWLADAAGLNGNMLWVPSGCRYSYWNPPSGPTAPCIRKTNPDARSGALLLVGDSVTREYAKSCMQFDLGKAKLVCVFNNIALEGQHYSASYATAVIDNILDAIVREKAAVFATNLGIHHMIGPCYTHQWKEFVQLFAEGFQKRLDKKAFGITLPTITGGNISAGARAAAAGGSGSAVPFTVEQLIWVGSPAIHYARRGMGYQRGVEWDEIAWAALRPLGFKRVNAHAPPVSRQEGTWDGLHYAAERGKVQTPWRNKAAPVRSWNGGVSSMLFTMFLNLVCFGDE